MIEQIDLKDKSTTYCEYYNDKPKQPDIIITNYTDYGYEGSGEGLVYIEKKWRLYNLGHCSCYDMWDNDYQIANSAIDFLKFGTEIYDSVLLMLKKLDELNLLPNEDHERLKIFL